LGVTVLSKPIIRERKSSTDKELYRPYERDDRPTHKFISTSRGGAKDVEHQHERTASDWQEVIWGDFGRKTVCLSGTRKVSTYTGAASMKKGANRRLSPGRLTDNAP